MMLGPGQLGQDFLRPDLDGNPPFPGQLLQSPEDGSLFSPDHEDLIQNLPLRLQGLEHRVDSVDDFAKHTDLNFAGPYSRRSKSKGF